MLFVHTPKAANKRPETHALQLCPAPAASAQKKRASWGFPRESVWVRESQQQRPVPPRAYSRPRGRGESQASLCCPSWRAGGGGVARGSGGPQPPPAPVAWLLGPHGRARTHLLVVLAQPDSHRIQLGHCIRAFPKLAGRAPVLPPVHGQARGRRRTPCTHGACCRSGTAARCRGHGHRPSSPPPGLALAAFPVRTRARARADATSFS